MYFLLFRIFRQLAFALKIRVALKIFTVFRYFLSFRIFGQLALALKTELALKFFKPVGAAAPPTPRLVRLCIPVPHQYGYQTSLSAKNCP